MFLGTNYDRNLRQKNFKLGQVALPFVLLISGIIIEIAISGLFVSYFLSTQRIGERLAVRAGSAARSGLEDAIIQISRNKEFSSVSCFNPPPQTYTLSIGADLARIDVCRLIDAENRVYVYSINSVGEAGKIQKKISAEILINTVNGKLHVKSIIEKPVL